MRKQITQPGANKLRYEIRNITVVAKEIEDIGTSIVWENIGDPISKGENIPQWIREKVSDVSNQNSVYAYSPTKGLDETREYIAHERNLEKGAQITADDILFFNGLGDAITKIYTNLHPSARVIGPNPAYPTHASAEAAHANKPYITYRLNPHNAWEPDLKELEQKIIDNKNIVAILIINPDNPTGFVYSRETLLHIVALAKKYDLFIISDEIYSNLAYPKSGFNKLASVIGDVPAIAMRGISKEFPWPGARCGWVEFYNRTHDEYFLRYTEAICNSKTLEVCSTTLPQKVLPDVMSDGRYYPHLTHRMQLYANRSARAVSAFETLTECIVHPARGAFYLSVVFRDGVLNGNQSLPLETEKEKVILPHLNGAPLDQRLTYYLLAKTGICVVPLSVGFNSDYYGFRMTLLEPDERRFDETVSILISAIRGYIAS